MKNTNLKVESKSMKKLLIQAANMLLHVAVTEIASRIQKKAEPRKWWGWFKRKS